MPTPLDDVLAPRAGPASLPELVAAAYRQAAVPLRARVLEALTRPLGTLALATIAAGAFANVLYRRSHDAWPVSLDDAARFTQDQVLELARFVEQCSPDALLQVGSMLADNPVGWAGVSGSLLALAIAVWRRRAAGARL